MDLELLAKRLGGLFILTMCTGLIMGLASCVNMKERKQRTAELEAGRVQLVKSIQALKAREREHEQNKLKWGQKNREKWSQNAVDAGDRCDKWMEQTNSDPAYEDYAAKHDLIHRVCALEGEWQSLTMTSSWEPSYKDTVRKAGKLYGRTRALLGLHGNYFKRKVKLLKAKAAQDQG